MKSGSLFLFDTYLFSVTTNIISTGIDERGNYFVPHATNYYYGGGGQPKDKANIAIKDAEFKIFDAKIIEGELRHYIVGNFEKLISDTPVTINIDPEERIRHAKSHTAGHLISSVVHEELRLGLLPLKGFHYPSEGQYVEFEVIRENFILDVDSLNEHFHKYIESNISVIASTVEPNSFDFMQSFRPSSFQQPADKIIRLVKIDRYPFLSYPCGGTHLRSTSELGSVRVTGMKKKKGNIRLSYSFT